ncbi:hypothetical protein [Halodesulfovibrio aestuarii]|uniref:Uncharacterized protein n=1 Tax=Halodesulfovibrio aestuarii TaxID=126333 RepID=A0ABV4JU39_9BACT
MKKRKTVAERLLDRLKEHPEIGKEIKKFSNPKIIRTYAGRQQRYDGAWSWMVDPVGDIGSADNMTKCLKAEKLQWFRTSCDSIEIVAYLGEYPKK